MGSTDDLHIFFIPFLLPGHMIPMVDIAKVFASRGVKATIVTVPTHVRHIQPAIDVCPYPMQLLTIRFPSAAYEKLITSTMNPDQLTDEFFEAVESLEAPFDRLLEEHRPDCIVSSSSLPWTAKPAVDRGIPRLSFVGCCALTFVVGGILGRLNDQLKELGQHEPFVVPGLPHRIELTRAQIITVKAISGDLLRKMVSARAETYGSVWNTCHELEPGYADTIEKGRAIGPVFLWNKKASEMAARGGDGGGDSTEFNDSLKWLDGNEPGSVLYVCFGSMGQFTPCQLREMAAGLEASGHPFFWVVRNSGDSSEWMPEGFEERVLAGEGRKGVLLKGWAPQMVILSHKAVGGFMTHCGWGSSMEGATSGLPMITWPLSSDHFIHEKAIVDVMRIGVPVGSKICSWREEERTLVSNEMVRNAVKNLMGDGEEANERRKRAKAVAALAKNAVEEGGSSYNNLTKLIEELTEVKRSMAKQ